MNHANVDRSVHCGPPRCGRSVAEQRTGSSLQIMRLIPANGANLDHAVLDIENAVEHIERAMVVGDDDDPGLALVGDLGEKLHDLPA